MRRARDDEIESGECVQGRDLVKTQSKILISPAYHEVVRHKMYRAPDHSEIARARASRFIQIDNQLRVAVNDGSPGNSGFHTDQPGASPCLDSKVEVAVCIHIVLLVIREYCNSDFVFQL